MTARFLALYETPSDPPVFDRHYQQTHIPLIHRLPGLRRFILGVILRPCTARRTT